MENETQKIFESQFKKLPQEVISFISSSDWSKDVEEIGSLYNLSEDELASLTREVVLVLTGLTHPDDFKKMLEQEVITNKAVLETVVTGIENKIFAPIRPALLAFFRKEAGEEAPKDIVIKTEPAEEEGGGETKVVVPEETTTPPVREFTSPFSAIIQPTPVKDWEKTPEVVPDNLPTEEAAESFLPNLTPKIATPTPPPAPTETTPTAPEETHPFEEKMKKVFTAGQQSMGEFAIGQAASQTPKASSTYHVDPYREPIE